MPRTLLDERSIPANYQREDNKKRRAVLRDTVDKIQRDHSSYTTSARNNHKNWAKNAKPTPAKVCVLPGDWGNVTLERSQMTGQVYAVLNMANAYHPGGGYLEGAVAQEENMYRRSDCHFFVRDEAMNSNKDRYTEKMTDLINGKNGFVYLDTSNARVCIKGSETKNGDGYPDLPQEHYFQFFELKAAADDLRGGNSFNAESMRKKIIAQLETLKSKNIRHVILSAFGCGAFANPAELVAGLYREELEKRLGDFDDVVFAVYHPGYGPDNFTPFKEKLDGLSLNKATVTPKPEPEPLPPIQQAQPTPPIDYASIISQYKIKLADPVWDTRGYVFLFFDYRKPPKGIVQMRALLNGPQSDQDKLKGLKQIAQNRLKHPPLFTKRTPEVSDLYHEILAIDENSLSPSARWK